MTNGAAIRPLPQQICDKICVALQACDMQGSLSALWGGLHRSEGRRQRLVSQSAEGLRRPSSQVGLHRCSTQMQPAAAACERVQGIKRQCSRHPWLPRMRPLRSAPPRRQRCRGAKPGATASDHTADGRQRGALQCYCVTSQCRSGFGEEARARSICARR